MKTLTKKDIIPIVIIFIAFIIGLQIYPNLPDLIPSHWNSRGEVDSFGPKAFVVFFMPFLALAIYFLMTFMPAIDPLRKNYEKFAKTYFWFKVFLSSFFVVLYFFMLASASGFRMNIIYFIVPIFSLLFILMGFMLPKIKRNWFIGIKTPWTIHSDAVWNDTHKFSGKVFIAAGIVSFFGMIWPFHVFAIFITTVLTAAAVSVVYSYFSFKKQGGFK